jgi:hypothetical protein
LQGGQTFYFLKVRHVMTRVEVEPPFLEVQPLHSLRNFSLTAVFSEKELVRVLEREVVAD